MNKSLIIAFWFFVVLVILLSNNPIYPVLKHNTSKTISYLFPQGWGFFTKDPKEVTVDIYQLEGNTLKLISVNNFSTQNLFGFSREARYIGYEFGKIGQCISKNFYHNKIGIVGKSYPKSYKIVKIPFIPKFYPINREYIVYQYKIIPFIWINQNQEQNKPYLVARIKLEYSPSVSYNNSKYD